MFFYLLIAYIIIYCVFALFLLIGYARLVPDEVKKTDAPWETPVDIVLIVIGLAGMVFLLTDLQSATLKAIWRPTSIVLAGAQVSLCLKDRISIFRAGEAKAGQSEVVFADISILLFLLPSLSLNIYYGFR